MNVIASFSLGTLVGLLLGLSASPLVGSFLAILVTGVLTFLSLTEKQETFPVSKERLIRLAAFCIAAIAALLVGISMRSNGWLGKSEVERKFAELTSIGISPEVVRAHILNDSSQDTIDIQKARSPVLWSSKEDVSDCAEMDPDQFSDVESVFAKYEGAGSPWEEFASSVKRYGDEAHQVVILKFLHKSHCR